MFKKGQYIHYGNHGVCMVEDITHMDMPGVDKNKLYYVLSKVYTHGNKIYTKVDNDKVIMREILSQKEAMDLIEEMPQIEQMRVENDKLRGEKYKSAMNKCDCKEWVRIIKSLYQRKQDCIANGKKVAVTDERFYKEVSEHLYGELAISLGIEKDSVEEFILSHVHTVDV